MGKAKMGTGRRAREEGHQVKLRHSTRGSQQQHQQRRRRLSSLWRCCTSGTWRRGRRSWASRGGEAGTCSKSPFRQCSVGSRGARLEHGNGHRDRSARLHQGLCAQAVKRGDLVCLTFALQSGEIGATARFAGWTSTKGRVGEYPL